MANQDLSELMDFLDFVTLKVTDWSVLLEMGRKPYWSSNGRRHSNVFIGLDEMVIEMVIEMGWWLEQE